MSKERLEDLKEEIEILTGYKMAYKEAIEQNKRYREVMKQVNNIIVEAIEALDNDEKVNGLEYAVKIIGGALEEEEK